MWERTLLLKKKYIYIYRWNGANIHEITCVVERNFPEENLRYIFRSTLTLLEPALVAWTKLCVNIFKAASRISILSWIIRLIMKL